MLKINVVEFDSYYKTRSRKWMLLNAQKRYLKNLGKEKEVDASGQGSAKLLKFRQNPSKV